MIITAYNPETDDLERSYLTEAVSAGATALSIKNNNRFAASTRIQIGESGHEKTEVVTCSGVSGGTALTVGTTVFPHEADDPVYVLRFDQVKFYRSTSGENGSYSVLAGTPVDLDVDNADLTTKFDDTTGVSTYYYKVSYYHSISTLESAQSDPVLGSGYVRNSVGFLIDEILREVKDEQEQFTSRTEVLGWFNEVNDDLLTRAKRPYSFLKTRTTLTRTANLNYVSPPTDMWKFERLEHNYTDTTTDPDTNILPPIRFLPLAEFRYRFQDQNIDASTVDDTIRYFTYDEAVNLFRFWPAAETTMGAAFYLWYWKTFTQIDSEGDVFETPTPRVYKLYALHKFYSNKATTDQGFLAIADRWERKYEAEIAKLIRANRKDAGSPRSFRFLPQTHRGNREY